MSIDIRIWGAASGAAVVALLAGGWFVGVQPALASATESAQTASSVDAQNTATTARIASLSKAAAKSDALEAENAKLLKSVPTILKPNTFIRRINEVAALDSVDVVSISPGDSAAYTAPEGISGVGASSLALGTTDPAISAANFTVVPVTVAISGQPDAVLQFTHDIQNDERVFAINSVQTSKSDTGSGVSSTLSGFIYTLKR
ncbi:hypothetical protein [Amnibacterium setariae]|uniref:Pilus assembly protein, PilO n=1 Tax=Amnibacterium setariae TaxID=2306585 RepID=A0A3A1U1R7_9MICO|nr:hypothetical protein [Amnibacterium setariae]RIX30313.1 hypothetical protein D1781_02435 [Amnibacterium setariae]